MKVIRLKLKNWRNFKVADIDLGLNRTFFVGPNASGKSNALDIFRFLRDIANSEGGGFQKAVQSRGGTKKIRCLAARNIPEVGVEVTLQDQDDIWIYNIEFITENRGQRRTMIHKEYVELNGEILLNRPDNEDKKDPDLLTQSWLEHTLLNRKFKSVADFFNSITYLHLVPQILKHPTQFTQNENIGDDYFGQSFLYQLAKATPKTLKSRLGKIEKALQMAVPNLKELKFEKDDIKGTPHLKALYNHWRPNAGWQREDQFSDGTLRLIALLWSLLDSKGLLLLEEPELSLNPSIVKNLAAIFHKTARSKKNAGQLLITTHSNELLSDSGISQNEIVMIKPHAEGSDITNVSKIAEITALLDAGFSPSDAIIPNTAPQNVEQMALNL